MKRFYIVQNLSDPAPHKPFRIIEKTITCDGPRDRITDLCYGTFTEAKEVADRLELIKW